MDDDSTEDGTTPEDEIESGVGAAYDEEEGSNIGATNVNDGGSDVGSTDGDSDSDYRKSMETAAKVGVKVCLKEYVSNELFDHIKSKVSAPLTDMTIKVPVKGGKGKYTVLLFYYY
jgi:hypothetical protein